MRQPDWLKQILDAPKASSEVVQVDTPVQDETESVPAEVAEEVRGLAHEELPAEEETLDHDPDGCDACLTAEAAEQEVHPEPTDVAAEEPPETAPPREPTTWVFDVRAASFKAFLSQLGTLVDTAKVSVSRDALEAKVVDPAHVAMAVVRLGDIVDGFRRQENGATRDFEPFDVGIDVEKLSELLRKAKKDEMLRVKMELPDHLSRDRLTFYVGEVTREMSAIDTAGMSDPQLPKLELPSVVELSAKRLLEAVKACGEVSDHVVLTLTKDGLNVFAEGDIDKVTIDLNGSNVDRIEVPSDPGTFRSMFPIDYLTAFLKAVKDERLVLRLGTDYPLRVDWDGITKGTYLLAPRIESE